MSNRTLAMSNSRQRIMEAGERYAQFDKSDPFARDRIISHIINGIAQPTRGSRNLLNEAANRDEHGKSIHVPYGEMEAYYDCDVGTEERSFTNARGDEVKYTVPTYRNLIRP